MYLEGLSLSSKSNCPPRTVWGSHTIADYFVTAAVRYGKSKVLMGSAAGLWNKGKGNSVFTQYSMRLSFNEWHQLEIHSDEWTESNLERCIPRSSPNKD